LPGANTLGYYESRQITAVKSFIALAPAEVTQLVEPSTGSSQFEGSNAAVGDIKSNDTTANDITSMQVGFK